MKSIERNTYENILIEFFLRFSRSTNYLKGNFCLFFYIYVLFILLTRNVYKNSVFLIKRSGFFFHLLKKHKFFLLKYIFSAEKVFIIEEEQKKNPASIYKNVNDAMNIWIYDEIFLLFIFFVESWRAFVCNSFH